MLVDAYDTRTGKKLPHRVRREAVGDPVVGPHLSLTPRAKAAERKAPAKPAVAPTAPTTGEKE